MTATLTDAQAAQLREAAQKMSDEQFPLLRELILALLDERDALRAERDALATDCATAIEHSSRNIARAEAAEADAARLRMALEAAGDALEKLAGAEALTVPFYLKDNNEGRELNARRDYAAEHFRAAREAAALTTKGTAE